MIHSPHVHTARSLVNTPVPASMRLDAEGALSLLDALFAHPTGADHPARLRALAAEIAEHGPALQLSEWLDAHGDATPSAHSLRVAVIAVGVGARLGVSQAYLAAVALGALLHDLGASLLPTQEVHPRVSADLATTRHPLPALSHQAILGHHERYDGRGTPYGLGGEDIPLPARLVGLANRLDVAMRRGEAALESFEGDGAEDPKLIEALQGLVRGASVL